MEQTRISELSEIARKVRLGIVEAVYSAASGHPGGSLSSADILTYLYFEEMHIDPADPAAPDRDRMVLSKGHACPIQYSALGVLGYFPEKYSEVDFPGGRTDKWHYSFWYTAQYCGR